MKKKSLIGICVFTILLVAGGMGTTKTASQLITDEQQFVCWLDSTVYVQKQKSEPICADFMLAEYEKDGQVFPAVYDDQITIWFEEKTITVQNGESQKFEMDMPTEVGDYLTSGWGAISLFDMNGDGNKDIVFTCIDHGTGLSHQMLYIVDIQNEQEIPLDYSVEELLAHMPQTEEFADILTDCAQDRREICEDGTIEVTSPFGTGDDWITDFVGEITGKLVYQAESNCYVLDEQSIGVEWYDDL